VSISRLATRAPYSTCKIIDLNIRWMYT
jgi:hypothetical protein